MGRVVRVGRSEAMITDIHIDDVLTLIHRGFFSEPVPRCGEILRICKRRGFIVDGPDGMPALTLAGLEFRRRVDRW